MTSILQLAFVCTFPALAQPAPAFSIDPASRVPRFENPSEFCQTWVESRTPVFLKDPPQTLGDENQKEWALLLQDLMHLEVVCSTHLSEETRESLSSRRQAVFALVQDAHRRNAQANMNKTAAALEGLGFNTASGPEPMLVMAGTLKAPGLAELAAPESSVSQNPDYTAPRWGKKEWTYTSAALAGTGLILTNDQEIRNGVQKLTGKSFRKVLNTFEPLGGPLSFAVPLAYYLHGKILGGGENSLRTAKSITQAALMTTIVTTGLKFSVGRERPTSGNGPAQFNFFNMKDASFPSGHTSHAFALATVVAKESHHPLVPYFAYGAATLVGLHRIDANAHWPADVFMGAAIGYGIATWVVDRNTARKNNFLSRLAVSPDVENRMLSFIYTFDE